MIKNLRFVLALFLFAGLTTACLEEPTATLDQTDDSLLCSTCQPPPPDCESVCTSTTSGTAVCTDEYTGDRSNCDTYRKAREGRNPMTGETIQIPAKTTLK